MGVLLPALVTLVAAAASLALRGRDRIVAPLAVAALVASFGLVAGMDVAREERVADLTLRMTPLARLVELVLLSLVILVTLYVSLVDRSSDFYPAALFVAASLHTLMTTTKALPLFVVLVGALAAPVLALPFRIRENRSLEAAVRYFGSTTVGASLGIAALALAAQQPQSLGEERLALTLLLVIVIATFALLLGTVPFHVHLASLTSEAPVPALALVFGVVVPLTFVAFPLLLAQSGVLPAVASVEKAQAALSALGVTSAMGGALLAVGAPDLRRLVAYSVLSNVGAALVGVATFSGSGLVGAVGTMLVTAAAATQQFLSAGELERARHPEDEGWSARRAPLAAATFLVSALALVGLPPLAGFPARFLVEQISFAVSAPLGWSLFAASVALLVAHLRAGLLLFSDGVRASDLERRPVAGTTGFVVIGGLLVTGLYPDSYLLPIMDFAREFLSALRPL